MKYSDSFSIRQMIELTGLSEFTIRGWENRYKAFSPTRGDTGRRKYSRTDVERALLLRELLKRGHKISRVAQLNSQKLKALFEQGESESQAVLNDKMPEAANLALELMALQKWSELDLLIKQVHGKNTSRLINEFLLPALQLLSAKVEAGLVSVSQEHVFSSFLKEKIYSALANLKTPKKLTGPAKKVRFVLAAPEGDYHESGLLMAHLLIRSHGFTSLYLGPHTPSRDLSETALRFGATHVLIVTTVSKKNGAHQEPLTFISDIHKKLGSKVQILVAGSQAPIAKEAGPSLSILGDFSSLERLLRNQGINRKMNL